MVTPLGTGHFACEVASLATRLSYAVPPPSRLPSQLNELTLGARTVEQQVMTGAEQARGVGALTMDRRTFVALLRPSSRERSRGSRGTAGRACGTSASYQRMWCLREPGVAVTMDPEGVLFPCAGPLTTGGNRANGVVELGAERAFANLARTGYNHCWCVPRRGQLHMGTAV